VSQLVPRLALLALAAVIAVAPAAAGTPSPADGPTGAVQLPAAALFTSLFALGTDLTGVGVSAAELASVGPSATASSSNGGTLLTVDDGVDCPNADYPTIQAAVTAASAGDKIKVCRGVYQEQVVIPAGKDGLTLFSEGFLQAVIKAPLLMSDPGDIVRVAGAHNVTIRHFKITGPLPDHLFCSLFTRTGVRIDQGGSATLTDNYITEIRSASPLLRGCQNGIAVLVGRNFETTTGSAEITHNLIDRYQKGGVVVDNAGSYGNVHHNEIIGVGPQPVIGQNGIQVSRGATADVDHNDVSENIYTLGGAGTGIILFQANGSGLTVGHNDVYRNDDGISLYDVDGSLIEHNNSHDQVVFDGLFADVDSTNNRLEQNRMERNFEHDCHDDSIGGGTAGTANFWIKNKGLTENRPGLCRH
jgi:hypothetical protein